VSTSTKISRSPRRPCPFFRSANSSGTCSSVPTKFRPRSRDSLIDREHTHPTRSSIARDNIRAGYAGARKRDSLLNNRAAHETRKSWFPPLAVAIRQSTDAMAWMKGAIRRSTTLQSASGVPLPIDLLRADRKPLISSRTSCGVHMCSKRGCGHGALFCKKRRMGRAAAMVTLKFGACAKTAARPGLSPFGEFMRRILSAEGMALS
jgi:hypothetical protein